MTNLFRIPLPTILLLLVFCVQSGPIEQLVTIPQLPYQGHNWYSGYLQFPGSRFHYVLFDSQRDPDNDPLILWLNGGPGCSSLIGMVYENGPFVFVPNTTTFELNKYSWNMRANVLYLESPGGVGFSTTNRTLHTDGTVAKDNLQALLVFFKKFNNLKKNDFYISGESYAGIYIPYLAQEIINYNRLPYSMDSKINLKGLMLGNACTDPLECYNLYQDIGLYNYQFLYNHGYYTEYQYDQIKGICTMGYNSNSCRQLMHDMNAAFAKTKTSILNIYSPCYMQTPTNPKKISQSGKIRHFLQDQMDCDDSIGITHFFNLPDIPAKLHVDTNITFSQCSDKVSQNYNMFSNASYWLYPILMKERLRIWVYSGDVDADVPITGTLSWMHRLIEEYGIPVEYPWREWWVPGLHKHDDQVGGMTWHLRGLTFASVKGAGHLVPRDKRQQAYILVSSFLNGVPLPFKTN